MTKINKKRPGLAHFFKKKNHGKGVVGRDFWDCEYSMHIFHTYLLWNFSDARKDRNGPLKRLYFYIDYLGKLSKSWWITAATIHGHSKEGVRIRHHGAIASEMGPKLKPFFSGQSFRSCKRHIHWHNRVYYPPSPMAKQHTMPTTEAAAATTMLHSDETEKFWRRRPTFCFSFKNVLP